MKAALTMPAARRPGLSHNPDLEAKALSWPPPTGGIKAAAVLVAPSLVYLLTCAHPSGTTSSFQSALRGERTPPPRSHTHTHTHPGSRHLQPPPHRRPKLPIASRHVSFPPKVRGRTQEGPAPSSLAAHPARRPGPGAPFPAAPAPPPSSPSISVIRCPNTAARTARRWCKQTRGGQF